MINRQQLIQSARYVVTDCAAAAAVAVDYWQVIVVHYASADMPAVDDIVVITCRWMSSNIVS